MKSIIHRNAPASGIGNHAGDDALKAVQVEVVEANLKLKQLRPRLAKPGALRYAYRVHV